MKNKLKTEYVDVSSLIPSEYNPRKLSDKAKMDLKKSISRYGLVEPLVVNGSPNRSMVLIGGHQRLKVAKEMGYKKVPVVFVNIPDIEKEKELNIRLNKDVGDWELSLLKDFDLDMLLDVGFDSGDLDSIWDDLTDTESDNFVVENEIKKIGSPTIKLGDMFELGNHHLIHGDATDPEVVKKLAGNDKVNVVYCDPPYNISLDYDKGFGKKSKYGGKVNDSRSIEEYRTLIAESLKNGLSVANKDAHVFYYCDSNYIWLIQQSFMEQGIKLRRVCLWVKNNQNPTSQIAFNKTFEPCVYGTIGAPFLNPINNYTEIMNKEIGTGNEGLDDLWSVKRLPGNKQFHPTEKPPTLHEKPLLRCSKPGDVILDLFGGSGSTLIACEQLNRRALLVELDPVFCELIIRRYEKLTGNKTKLLR